MKYLPEMKLVNISQCLRQSFNQLKYKENTQGNSTPSLNAELNALSSKLTTGSIFLLSKIFSKIIDY